MINRILFLVFGRLPKNKDAKQKLLKRYSKPVNLLHFTLKELNKN